MIWKRFFLCILCFLGILGKTNAQIDLEVKIRPQDQKNKNSGTAIVPAGNSVRVYLFSVNPITEDFKGYVSFKNAKTGEIMVRNILVYLYPNQKDVTWVDLNFPPNTEVLLEAILSKTPIGSASTTEIVDKTNPIKIIADTDTDKDGIYDSEDADDDNDEVADNIEIAQGTQIKNYDTDGDGTPDSADDLPLNRYEIKDTDKDGIGDILDTNDDNDGLTDKEEVALGTNPKLADSDADGLPDQKEILFLSDPLEPDTDRDGVLDFRDISPNNPSLSIDTDADKKADEIDVDDDNDGFPDQYETQKGSDPKNAESLPVDAPESNFTKIPNISRSETTKNTGSPVSDTKTSKPSENANSITKTANSVDPRLGKNSEPTTKYPDKNSFLDPSVQNSKIPENPKTGDSSDNADNNTSSLPVSEKENRSLFEQITIDLPNFIFDGNTFANFPLVFPEKMPSISKIWWVVDGKLLETNILKYETKSDDLIKSQKITAIIYDKNLKHYEISQTVLVISRKIWILAGSFLFFMGIILIGIVRRHTKNGE